jgi:hypothetical protein
VLVSAGRIVREAKVTCESAFDPISAHQLGMSGMSSALYCFRCHLCVDRLGQIEIFVPLMPLPVSSVWIFVTPVVWSNQAAR